MNGLVPVDEMEITVIVDNVTDGLSTTLPEATSEMRTLFASGRTGASSSCLCSAAHGLSLLVTTRVDARSHTMLFDTGPDSSVFERNVSRLAIDLGSVDEVFLSHGHWDHCGAALLALDRIRALSGRATTPVHVHPSMFRSRGITMPDGSVSWMDEVPSLEELTAFGASPVGGIEPRVILAGTVFSSGEVPRVTDYERGLPGHVARTADGGAEPDERIDDERWAAVEVEGLGVVVLTACSHAGIGNILEHARHAFGGTPLHAVVGGLHLAGPNEQVIGPSSHAIEASGASIVAPGHCTGWRATAALSQRLSGRVQPLAVGMRLRFAPSFTVHQH